MKDDEDIEKSLAKLPKAYRKLVHGFHIKLEPNNTLSGDDGHVGVVMTHPKRQIKVAAPWNYSRSFCFLHEVGHLVWQTLDSDTKKKWSEICKKNPGRKKEEPDEENFCHSFAARYSKHPPTTHYHPEWIKFIDNLPK